VFGDQKSSEISKAMEIELIQIIFLFLKADRVYKNFVFF